MPRVKKESPIEENLSNVELAEGRRESLTISKLKKEAESLNEQISFLQNLLRICIFLAGIHLILITLYNMRANDHENNHNNNSRVTELAQSKHDATSVVSNIISSSKRFYYRNDNGDLIKIKDKNTDCLIEAQKKMGSGFNILESCFYGDL